VTALRYLLDTNICIFIVKEKPPRLLERFRRIAPGEMAMSIITFGELEFGARKSTRSKAALAVLDQLRGMIPALPVDLAAAQEYGRIREELERVGRPIGNNDLWIAAHASALKVSLVTNNRREFDRVKGLSIEDWSV